MNKYFTENDSYSDYTEHLNLNVVLNVKKEFKNNHIIGSNFFEKMKELETPWKAFLEWKQDYEKTLTDNSLVYNAHNTFKILSGNRYFVFGIYHNMNDKGYSFSLWDEQNRSLGDFDLGENFEFEIPSNEFIDWIEKVLDNYCNNLISCSECGRWIPIKDVAGTCFAGQYCKDCWESKWKAIEATMSYD